jgi:DNA primase
MSQRVRVHCPFHTEKTPSCQLDLETMRFLCFGCGASGEIKMELVQDVLDIDD